MTTTIRGTDDSAAAPALTGNDTDTGIYFPAADTLGLVTGGTEQVRVDSSGKVGIGTSTPTDKVQIVSGNLLIGTDSGDAFNSNAFLRIQDSGNAYIGIKAGNTSTSGILFGDVDDDFIGGMQYGHNDDSLRFNANDAERMRIDSGGKVGIGTSSPAFGPLHVNSASGAAYLHITNATVGELSTDGASLICDTDGSFLIRNRENAHTALYTNNAERMRITSAGEVLVGGTTSLAVDTLRATLSLEGAQAGMLNFFRDDTTTSTNNTLGSIRFFGNDTTSNTPVRLAYIEALASGTHAAGDNPTDLIFGTTPDGSETVEEQMRLTQAGDLLVGTTSSTVSGGAGLAFQSSGRLISRYTASSTFDRRDSDGDIVTFQKDGTTVGSIAIQSYGFEVNGESSHSGISFGSVGWIPLYNGSRSDNFIDLGNISYRFDDIYATNNVIQTSDRNEKQDIEELSEAETRVAVAAKALMRKYRWKSAVAEKGDDARIHFGIIAQDLKAAFEAEGLDAGRYAMFIHSAWWEKERVIPAVEAQEAVYETQTDEEGNETQVLVSEAVEAQPEKTVIDTFQSEEEAGEGAVRKERMGIRYNELLAFIIAAI